MKRKILIVLLSIFILGCNSDDINSETVTIESTLIAKNNLYGNGQEGIIKQNLLVTNQSKWDALITQINSVNTISEAFSETNIDFSKYIIIAVFDDVKTNGGHSIELSIVANSKNIIVDVTNTAPQGNSTTVITQPFHIIKILKPDLPILFE